MQGFRFLPLQRSSELPPSTRVSANCEPYRGSSSASRNPAIADLFGLVGYRYSRSAEILTPVGAAGEGDMPGHHRGFSLALAKTTWRMLLLHVDVLSRQVSPSLPQPPHNPRRLPRIHPSVGVPRHVWVPAPQDLGMAVGQRIIRRQPIVESDHPTPVRIEGISAIVGSL